MQLTKWHHLQVFIDSNKARWGSINQFIADCDTYKLKLKGTDKRSLTSPLTYLLIHKCKPEKYHKYNKCAIL